MLVTRGTPRGRRGIALVLVLAMLGLLALIAVTFAAYSAQAKINARNFALAAFKPQADELFDFALSQLVGDTADVRSVIRGHSLARDMYGNDAFNNGYLAVGPTTGQPFLITAVTSTPGQPYLTLTTNILNSDPGFFGYNFTRWLMRVTYTGSYGGPGSGMAKPVDQTLEIQFDNTTSGQYRTFTVNAVNTNDQLINPTLGMTSQGAFGLFLNSNAIGNGTQNFFPFVLDGRFLRAFNGAGLSDIPSPTTSVPEAYYGNFRFNPDGLSPNQVGMDEDYDACDLDNWFLAIQSADGHVMIPSFHRPGIIRVDNGAITNTPLNDWQPLTAPNFYDSAARILRPIQGLGNDAATFPDLLPDPTTGKITYDVDNDGDGVTDSVWLDLGYPARRNASGKLYKPLFAFMVIGLNGRIPLNTAGNLANPTGPTIQGLVNGTQYNFQMGATHATHLGNSISEIDPTYALQNAFDKSTLDPPAAFTALSPSITTIINGNYQLGGQQSNGQIDSSGVDVRLTQLRNLLAGTRPQPNPSPGLNIQNFPNGNVNGDLDLVLYSTGPSTEGQPYFMPNGIAGIPGSGSGVPDAFKTDGNTGLPYVTRTTTPVPGRWGEANSVPGIPFANPYGNGGATPPTPQFVNVVGTTYADVTGQTYGPAYNNQVRAGYSLDVTDLVNGTPRDAADDNFNAFDPMPLGHVGEVGDSDFYDVTGALQLPVERIRRFVTPMDINGTGFVTAWRGGRLGGGGGGPSSNGYDAFGRVQFSSYYRPAGSPGVINYSGAAGGNVGSIIYPWASGANYAPDLTNNLLHGFESFRFPYVGSGGRAQSMGGAPYDFPLGIPATPIPYPPPTFPTYDASVNSVTNLMTNGAYNPSNFPGRNSDGVNDAEEMNLYTPNALLDSPYGPSDLEWLYRQQDVDGASLSSRLSQLAPISLTNGLDGQRRRRLFSLDSFDTNAFVWANDNPGGAFPNNSSFLTAISTNPINIVAQSASFAQLSLNPGNPYQNLIPYIATPTLAHRDRKINLNYPLPVSNDPNEPIRQKWITDTYNLMKSILPPRAIDTPEERAQLSQYIINIIDFRDPDATMTHWVNPDIAVYSPQLATAGATAPTIATQPYTLQFVGTTGLTSNQIYLDQYGMEYNPVAINEAMAYTFRYSPGGAGGGTPLQTYRFMIELVNTQTQPAMVPGTVNAGILDLGNNINNVANDPYGNGSWDIVFAGDDPYSRPDPYTGQLPYYGNLYGLTPLNQDSFYSLFPSPAGSGVPTPVPGQDVQLLPLLGNRAGANNTSIPIPQQDNATAGTLAQNYFYVFGNLPPMYAASSGGKQSTTVYEAGALQPGTYYASINQSYTNGYNPPMTAAAMIQTLYNQNVVNSNLPGTTLANGDYDPFDLNNVGPNPLQPQTIGLPGFFTTPAASSGLAPQSLRLGVIPGLQQGAGATGGTPPNTYLWKVPAPAANSSYYIWVCLRRPANPFAPVSANNPMLVVDSMRIPYVDGTGSAPNGSGVSGTVNTIYSAQRFQPYRGGHAVPPMSVAGTPTNAIDTHYGYSEQIVAPTYNSLPALATILPVGNPQQAQGIYTITTQGANITQNAATAPYFHTMGWANEDEMGATLPTAGFVNEFWDYFPFHDRDFTSVAELMLVPATAPGLFTKQFAEFAPSQQNVTNIFSSVTPLTVPSSLFSTAIVGGGSNANLPAIPPFTGSTTTGSGLTWVLSAQNSGTGRNMFTIGNGPGFVNTGGTPSSLYATASTPLWSYAGIMYAVLAPPVQPHTFPYLSDRFFYSGFGGANSVDTAGKTVGGYAADGWFKMFEFVEVPSAVLGATGTVSQGINFDWVRQDMRPGQLNLNLIIDEEVFLSVLGRQSYNPYNPQIGAGPTWDQFTQTRLNFDQITPSYVQANFTPGSANFPLPLPAGANPIPMVVTSTLSNGSPASAYPFATAGANYGNPALAAYDPVTNYFLTANGGTPIASVGLKAAWVQFLWLRHGGSGYMFGHGFGAVGQNYAITPTASVAGAPAGFGTMIPKETPFRALSYPDIDFTVMRPAALPPTGYTNPPLNTTPNLSGAVPQYYTADPGVRAPETIQPATGATLTFNQGYPTSTATGVTTYYYPGSATTMGNIYYPYLPPPIPPRRLFQMPDLYFGVAGTPPSATSPAPSHASEGGDPYVNNMSPLATVSLPGPPGVLPPLTNGTNAVVLTDNVVNLYWPSGNPSFPGGSAAVFTSGATLTAIPLPVSNVSNLNGSPTPIPSPYLGANGTDLRQHPFYRSEEMQRVLNLTTVRTHQYAVWITVGFFEVKRQGDLGMLASATPYLAFDIMGPEITGTSGASARFREFVLIDRLKLTGFNHLAAGQFRHAVVYRRRIQ